MDQEQKRRLAEAAILASPEPISPAAIAELIPRCNPSQVRALVKELNEEYVAARRAFEIWEVSGGFQFRSLPEFAPYLRQLQKIRPLRLSQAALETLAVVAYRQPVTRAEVEHVRGVDVGAVLRSLLDRQLVRIAGHREVPGRPIVYATSRRFLEVFGLTKLSDLPALRDFAELAEAVGGDADEADLSAYEAPGGAAQDGAEDAGATAPRASDAARDGSEPGVDPAADADPARPGSAIAPPGA